MAACSQIVADRGYAIALCQSFIRCPEKRFVCLDRTAKGASEVIPLERRQTLSSNCRGRRVELVPRVHGAVSKVLEHSAMELVGTALADENHLAAHGQAILCRERIGDDLEFPYTCQSQGCAHDGRGRLTEDIADLCA